MVHTEIYDVLIMIVQLLLLLVNKLLLLCTKDHLHISTTLFTPVLSIVIRSKLMRNSNDYKRLHKINVIN